MIFALGIRQVGAKTGKVLAGVFGSMDALMQADMALEQEDLVQLSAEIVAQTHGDPEAFLAGAALSYILSRILWEGEENLAKLTHEAAGMLRTRFGGEYRQTKDLVRMFRELRSLTRRKEWSAEEALRSIGNETAAQILMGALYLCMAVAGDLEKCLTLAAGWAPAGAAVAGAILGALGGEEAIPEHLLEELECADVLRELAGDLFGGCPMMRGSRIFDVEWDEKYNSSDL